MISDTVAVGNPDGAVPEDGIKFFAGCAGKERNAQSGRILSVCAAHKTCTNCDEDNKTKKIFIKKLHCKYGTVNFYIAMTSRFNKAE